MVEPITVQALVKDDRKVTSAEPRELRGLLGAMQWPATLGCPHLACNVSMQQGCVGTSCLRDLCEANKLLKFGKADKELKLKFCSLTGQVENWTDLGFLTLSDAAWATRADGSSQGGYLTSLVTRQAFDDKLDRRSWKLARE